MTENTLTPTDKLKEVRKIAREINNQIGRVVTYDDPTTDSILLSAEKLAVAIIETTRENNMEDIMDAVHYHITGENL